MSELKKLSQDDIDNIISKTKGLESSFLRVDNGGDIMIKYRNVLYAKKRLEWSRENQTFDQMRAARHNLHYAAFSLWLANRRINMANFKSLIRGNK